jgi:hypothetical protein
MPERINGGQVLVVLGAITLLISLFLNWFEPSRSAWTVFEVWDLVLAAIALAAIAAAMPLRIGGASGESTVPRRWLPALGIAALVIVFVTLVNHPPAARGAGVEVGAWIALVGSILLTAGGVLSRARISLVITLRSTDQPASASRHQPAPTAPEAGPAPREGASPDPGVDPDTATQTLPRQS